MPYDYTEDASVALEMLNEFGQSLTITGLTGGDNTVYPPIPATEQTQSAVGLTAKLGQGDKDLAQYIAQGTQVKSVLKLIIAASGLTFAPRAGHTVTLGGEQWAILGVTPLSPGGTPILYTCAIHQ